MATRIVLVLLHALLVLPASAHAVDGSNVFETRCRLCHEDAGAFQNKNGSQIKRILQSGKVADHRFALSEDEIDAVVHYLEQQGQRN